MHSNFVKLHEQNPKALNLTEGPVHPVKWAAFPNWEMDILPSMLLRFSGLAAILCS